MENKTQLLILNGTLITRDPANPFIEKGALLIEGNIIQEVGTSSLLRGKYPNAQVLDGTGKLVMPGYINAHHHIYSAFARGMTLPDNHPKNFLEILEGTWWRMDRALTLENTYNSAIATYCECIRNGVTTLMDHHASYKAVTGSLEEIGKAADLLGVRTCLAYEISDRDGEEKMREALAESLSFVNLTLSRTDGMQKALMGLHASFTLSDETLAFCQEMNVDKTGYHVHVAEGPEDQEHCLSQHGCSVVERLVAKGILNEKALAGHCIHISESDMDLLAEAKVTVVHNPQSNMANAVGAPDVLTMMDKGIAVCLGTDGYTTDMLESAKTAIVLQKHRSGNPDRGFAETSKMLFENNAKLASEVFGLTIGELKAGAVADVILVDYVPFTPLNETNVDGHIFFGLNGQHTDTTICNGQILMKNKKILADWESLSKECRASSEKLWRALYE